MHIFLNSDFHYLQRQINRLAKLQLVMLSHHGDTALDNWIADQANELICMQAIGIKVYQCLNYHS